MFGQFMTCGRLGKSEFRLHINNSLEKLRAGFYRTHEISCFLVLCFPLQKIEIKLKAIEQ